MLVELEADIRILRKVLRNGVRGQAHEQTAQFYLEKARLGQALHVEPSRAFADFVVRGDADLERQVRLLSRVFS